MKIRTQVLLLVASIALLCAGAVAWLGYRGARAILLTTLEAQVRAMATTAAAAVDPEIHHAAERGGSTELEAYRQIERRLRELRDLWRGAGVEVKFIYTMVRDPRSPSGYAYVVDAEEPGPLKSLPGTAVTMSGPRRETAGMPREAIARMSVDEFGETLTGLAPISAHDGRVEAMAGVDLPVSVVRALERELLGTGLAAAGLATILGLGAGWLLVRRIVGPLERLRAFASTLADGDLAGTLEPAGAREVVSLGETLDSLRGSLRRIVARVQEASVCAHEACVTLSHRATQEGDRARSAATDAIEAAGRAEEIAVTSRALAGAADELRSTSSAVIAAGAEGLENLRGIADSVEHLRETGAALATQLATLRERARAVDLLLEAMVAVADRSNLLSLNAEIEASKAGDAGRGFMVVAAEIRRLADQAAASSLEIENHVRTMHQAVDAGADATTQLAQSLATTAGRARHGATLLTTSIDGIESLHPRIASVAESSARQLERAEAISRAMGGIAESTTNALAFFEAVEGMVGDLKRRGADLAREVARFRV